MWRSIFLLVMAIGVIAPSPATAQFFMKNPDFSGEPVRGDEPGLFVPLPNATPDELRAGMVWSLRAALNVSALGCDFAPILLTAPTYNAVLADHRAELASSFDRLGKYFARMNKAKAKATTEFDKYQTRVYSSFTTVYAQYNFCQTAAMVARDAIFTPRGELNKLAENRLREIRNSLVARGEQRFAGRNSMETIAVLRMDPICWKNDRFDYRKCPNAY
ncbi:MAG: hypothetical protein B7Y43_08240 [Sphingomonas sp. 28-62-20]|uniref:hypothetical protein n=1 Tax=unclassified Sphingomonas TaxID=196159 RepID=UPI000BCF30DA|nr:hypothetical protein [Sphingomonas sp.]OYY77919.1 MAG: hypothetical protein B7Y43_08240 [Sphingomonas sp. 28-62-20]